MKERPILMNAEMVRATLDGRKTQTRRIVKPALVEAINFLGGGPEDDPAQTDGITLHYGRQLSDNVQDSSEPQWLISSADYPDEGCIAAGQLYGAVGDELWVRETHSIRVKPEDSTTGCGIAWHREGSGWDGDPRVKWKPSIHMPRWASRISLRITEVRCERLNDISEADALAEGISRDADYPCAPPCQDCACGSPVTRYQILWESINGAGSWERNDWVWAISFERVKR